MVDVVARDLPTGALDLAQGQELRFGVLMPVADADPGVDRGALRDPILSLERLSLGFAIFRSGISAVSRRGGSPRVFGMAVFAGDY
jgi:hypothetical protein